MESCSASKTQSRYRERAKHEILNECRRDNVCVFSRLEPLVGGGKKAKIVPLNILIPEGHASDNCNIHVTSSRFSCYLTFKFR